jgi:hypothetical protein
LLGRAGRSCASDGWRIFRFCRRARADIRKIGAHPHFSEKYLSLENIITRRAPAISPFSFDVVSGVIGTDLLAVTINAAVRSVNAPTPLGHSRLRLRINVSAVLFHLRIEMSDLPIRDHG